MDDDVASLEDNDVEIAKDNAAELEISHNSTFVLSKNKAATIKGVTIKKPQRGKKSITVKWKKQSGKILKSISMDIRSNIVSQKPLQKEIKQKK